MIRTLRTLTLIAALSSAFQAAAEIRPLNSIALEVNSEIITYGAIQRTANELKARAGNQDIPQAQLLQAAKEQLLERTLLANAAKMQGLSVSEAQIDTELQRRAAAQKTTVETLYKAAAAHGYNRNAYRLETAKDLLIERQFLDLTDGIQVSEAQINAAAAQMQAAGQALPAGQPYTVYTVRRLILNANSVANMPAVGGRINQIAQAVQQGSDFETIVRRYSQEPQAANGGIHDNITAYSLPHQLETMISEMQPGQITIPIASGTTWQMVQLIGSRTESDPAKMQREALRRLVIQAEQQKVQQQFIGQLQQNAVVREY